MKSELAIKRDEWFASDQGRQCCADGLNGHGRAKEYLKNRLEAAFLAGAKAQSEVDQEFCDKVIDAI